ncbi:hypothetical protein HUG20_08405 [Salicibibacter cibi]|uniref:Uncharacterized protein n=1 Tax=Salicibibacter cibi TaxID=2743001 RepID=A0A7T6ZAS2_9BACI|nr:hypothetical protein [Salicibibacter cibi]QQK79902.1 hypothetical protein HUG20_08405 [Salicibibacter cibi]
MFFITELFLATGLPALQPIAFWAVIILSVICAIFAVGSFLSGEKGRSFGLFVINVVMVFVYYGFVQN